MSELIYPTLDLFVYDLREGLGENSEEIAENQEYFARRIPERRHQLLKQRDSSIGEEYVELLGKKGRELFDSSTTQYSLKGWYYPVRLGDSYGLLLDCSVEHSLGNRQQAKNQPLPVNCFADLKIELEKRLANTPSSIGQVWMLSGQLPNFSPDNAEAIALECSQISAFNLNWNLDFRGQSSFLGGMLFEFWRYSLHTLADLSNITSIHEIQDNNYVLIAIYPDTETAKKASEFNFDCLPLFAYRSKILWAYAQSQYIKKKLRADFASIQKYQKDFNQVKSDKLNLNKLRHILVDSQDTQYHYSINLNYLSILKRTIEVNQLNYERRLIRIKQKLAAKQDNSELQFLQEFSDKAKQYYLEQVKNDYESLNPGMTLVTDLTNAIRAVTEIERAERDRAFQSTVAIVGVGLAASSFIASIAGQFPGATNPKEAAKYPVGSVISQLGVPEPWLSPAVSATVSVGVGVVAAVVTWLIIKLFESFKK